MSSALELPQNQNPNAALPKSNFRIRWRLVLTGLGLLAFGLALPFALNLYYSSHYSRKTDSKSVKIIQESSPETNSSKGNFEKQKQPDEIINFTQAQDFALLSEIDAKQLNQAISAEKISHVVSANPADAPFLSESESDNHKTSKNSTVSMLRLLTAPRPQTSNKSKKNNVKKSDRLAAQGKPAIESRTVILSCPQGKIPRQKNCGNTQVIFSNATKPSRPNCGDIRSAANPVIWDLSTCGEGTHSITFVRISNTVKKEVIGEVAVKSCDCISLPNPNVNTNSPNLNTNSGNDNTKANTNIIANNTKQNTNEVTNNSNENNNRTNNSNENTNNVTNSSNPNTNGTVSNTNKPINTTTPTASPAETDLVNENPANIINSSGNKDKFSYAYPSRFIKGKIYEVCLSLQPNQYDVNLCENPVDNPSHTGGTTSTIKKKDIDAYVTANLKPGSGLEIRRKPEQMRLPYDRNAEPKELPRWIWELRLLDNVENLDKVELNFECEITSGNQKFKWESGALKSGVGLPFPAKITSFIISLGGALAFVLGFVPMPLNSGEIKDILEKAISPIILKAGMESVEDEVNCTLFAPNAARPASSFLVQVFAHLNEQTGSLEEIAKTSDEAAQRQAIEKLSRKIKRGSELTFELVMPKLEIDEPVQSHCWEGEILKIPFIVSVSENHPPGDRFGKVIVSENGTPIGRITFKVKITTDEEEENIATAKLNRYKYAFISYASEDRPKVLPRVQMLDAAKIRYFQDILNLDPGDRWARELYKYIDKSDVLFLFWSSAASRSEWVEKEVLYALKRHGEDENAPPDIIPIIIEGPPPAKPPEKLKFLHFNDKFIYFIYAAEAESKIRKADKT